MSGRVMVALVGPVADHWSLVSASIDKTVRFRVDGISGQWKRGLTTYSLDAVGQYLVSHGRSAEFVQFEPIHDLPQTDDPLRTYTARLASIEGLIHNGANIIAGYGRVRVFRGCLCRGGP